MSFFRKLTRKGRIPPENSPGMKSGDLMKCEHCGTEQITESHICPKGMSDFIDQSFSARIQQASLPGGVLDPAKFPIDPAHLAGNAITHIASGGVGGGGGWYNLGTNIGMGGGAGGSISSIDPGMWIGDEINVRLNKKELALHEVQSIIQQCIAFMNDDETLILKVDDENTVAQNNLIKQTLDGCGIKSVMVSNAEFAKAPSQSASTEDERVDILTRVGLIWRENPTLKLGELLFLMIGDKLMTLDDYVLVEALEKAYGSREDSGRDT